MSSMYNSVLRYFLTLFLVNIFYTIVYPVIFKYQASYFLRIRMFRALIRAQKLIFLTYKAFPLRQ